MRQAILLDTISLLGQRNLAMAFRNNAGKFLKGYNFNPDALLTNVVKIDFKVEEERDCLFFDSFITNEVLVFPDTANIVGLRLHYLSFDFMTENNQLTSSEWNLIGKDTLIDGLILQVPIKNVLEGTLFTILEIQFYIFDDGSYIPLLDDRSKVVFIIDVKN